MALSFEPVLQAEAGIEYPWQGILLGLERPPVSVCSSDNFMRPHPFLLGQVSVKLRLAKQRPQCTTD